MIFSDMGVNPTPGAISVYDEIIAQAGRARHPTEQIATIGDADTDAKKQALFEHLRSGAGPGAPWAAPRKWAPAPTSRSALWPCTISSALEAGRGRAARRPDLAPGQRERGGGDLPLCHEGSFDAYMWQALETKARFIAQVMTGEVAARRAEDIGGQELSYAEVKAIASGNPAVLTLAETDAELQRLHVLKKHHADEQYLARRKLRELPAATARLKHRLTA